MTPGREYGLGKYGRNTYDHWRQTQWVDVPAIPPIEIWLPSTIPVDGWAPSFTVPINERWVPIVEPLQPPWTVING